MTFIFDKKKPVAEPRPAPSNLNDRITKVIENVKKRKEKITSNKQLSDKIHNYSDQVLTQTLHTPFQNILEAFTSDKQEIEKQFRSSISLLRIEVWRLQNQLVDLSNNTDALKQEMEISIQRMTSLMGQIGI